MKRWLLLVLLLGIVTATGCGSHQANTPGSKSASVFTIADATGDWGFPAPYTHYLRGPGYVRMSLIFDTLVWKDRQGITPALAHSWDFQEEENAYIFNLRDDVTFHDGKPLTARDVVFSFQYAAEHPYPWCDTGLIHKAEALNTYTAKIYLNEAFAPFITNIAAVLPVLPEHIYQKITSPEEYMEPPAAIGTGPFKLVDYNKHQGTYLFAAFKEYYGGSPRVDQLRFIKVNEQVIPAAIRKGEVAAGPVQPDLATELKQEGYTLLQSGHDWNAKLVFNWQQPPFNNKELRSAVAYAINRSELVNIVLRGHGVKGNPGLIPPDSSWYSPSGMGYDYNPARTRQLLEDMGFVLQNGKWQKEGQPLEFELLISSRFSRDAELIKNRLEKAGIGVNIRSMEAKTVDSRVQNWNFDCAIIGHGGLGSDPAYLNQMILGDGFNSTRYDQNPEMKAMIEEQLHIIDQTERKGVIAQIQRIYASELPALTLYYTEDFWAHDGSVDLYYTPGGIGPGVPLPLNKLSFVSTETKVD